VSIGEKLIEELERDPKIRKRLAELMVTDSDVRLAIINAVLADVATKGDLERMEAATKAELEKLEAATKRELEKLEERLRTEMENLRAEMKSELLKTEERLRSEIQREVRSLEDWISELDSMILALENRVNSIEERLARLEGQMGLFVKLFIAFNLPILIAVIGILLKMVFA
jgi:tRNA U34 5-carboxymethylaminomethyl modifying GTPase MnmE/TrmE